jgi:hypothetical protein
MFLTVYFVLSIPNFIKDSKKIISGNKPDVYESNGDIKLKEINEIFGKKIRVSGTDVIPALETMEDALLVESSSMRTEGKDLYDDKKMDDGLRLVYSTKSPEKILEKLESYSFWIDTFFYEKNSSLLSVNLRFKGVE